MLADAVSPPGCDAGYQLFSEVLNHLALVDYSITQHTATRVRHCMQKIVDCVLQPSISMSLSKEQVRGSGKQSDESQTR